MKKDGVLLLCFSKVDGYYGIFPSIFQAVKTKRSSSVINSCKAIFRQPNTL